MVGKEINNGIQLGRGRAEPSQVYLPAETLKSKLLTISELSFLSERERKKEKQNTGHALLSGIACSF